jgi:hypothetical protein
VYRVCARPAKPDQRQRLSACQASPKATFRPPYGKARPPAMSEERRERIEDFVERFKEMVRESK